MKKKALEEKLKMLDRLISEEELIMLRDKYERQLVKEEKKPLPRNKEIEKLYGLIDFVRAWGAIKRERSL